jgi:DNA-binding MarR family transcriptional regulator
MRPGAATRVRKPARPVRMIGRRSEAHKERDPFHEVRDPMNDFIGYKVKRLQHAIMSELEAILRPYNLRAMDFAILNIVSANPGIHQGGVAALLGAEPPAVVLASDRLESADLLARYSDPKDRRLRALHLTPNGAKLLPLVVKDVNAQERKLQSAIQNNQRANFEGALDRLLRAYSILK